CLKMCLMYICGFGLQLNLKADVSKLTITHERPDAIFSPALTAPNRGSPSRSLPGSSVVRLPGLRRTYMPYIAQIKIRVL
ncbi:MAG TPA: hypothetical protein VIH90_00835, partial [Candidatus Saccharimonadales bacterium]